MIQSTIKNTEKGALLSTQNLVEAETLCDRIAIMVSGRLRWVPFHILHLTPKTRFPMKRDSHQMEFFFSAPSVMPFPLYLKFRNNVKNFRANISFQHVFLLVHRCIGSIQHLKSKLGKDYILELRVQEASQVTLVHTEILKLFPQAALQER